VKGLGAEISHIEHLISGIMGELKVARLPDATLAVDHTVFTHENTKCSVGVADSLSMHPPSHSYWTTADAEEYVSLCCPDDKHTTFKFKMRVTGVPLKDCAVDNRSGVRLVSSRMEQF
jgi:hypothetical protein